MSIIKEDPLQVEWPLLKSVFRSFILNLHLIFICSWRPFRTDCKFMYTSLLRFERELLSLCVEMISGDIKGGGCYALAFCKLTLQIKPNSLVKKWFIALIKRLLEMPHCWIPLEVTTNK